MKQGNNVRDHSLNLPQFITIPRLRLGIVNIEIWTTPSLRGEVVRNYRNSAIVQSLDSNKSRLITRRNTTLINYQSLMSGNLIRKCYYSSSSEVIERLENSKRELEAVLAHKLRQNVLDYKRDNKTVWLLDDQNIDSSNIKLGIKTYISICSFLTAVKTSKIFTRYLNLNFNSSSLLNPKYEENTLDVKSTLLTNLENIDTLITKLVSSSNLIVSDEPIKFSRRNRFSNVYRENLNDQTKWNAILNDSRDNLENIIFKYWSVELTQSTNGAKTAGIDGKAFKSKGKLFQENEGAEAHKYIAAKYKRLSKILSLSKGRNDQSINRKGIAGLNDQEKLRRHLKSALGKEYISNLRTELRLMKYYPVEYANKMYHFALEHNNQLKFELCNYIRNTKLKNYKSQGILRVYIPKANGKLRPLGIPTIRDRCLQVLLKLVMEPYMEPLGDELSFGFRPGRNCHQATAYAHHRLLHYRSSRPLTLKDRAYLDVKMKMIYLKPNTSNKASSSNTKTKTVELKGKVDLSTIDPKNNIKVTIPGFGKNVVRRKQIMAPSWLYKQATEKSDKIIYDTQYIIDADIKGCFDNISHEWLIDNVPMPTNYEHLLPSILKVDIYELDKDKNKYNEYTINKSNNLNKIVNKCDNKTGIPQGGIISPLLMNWTLDGLQHHVKMSAHNLGSIHNLYSIDRADYLKKKDLREKGTTESEAFYRNRTRIEWYNTTWFVRYADDFLVGVKSEFVAKELINKISEFLLERGLTLSAEKTNIIPWKIGKHVDFLGWTHSLIKPKKVNWMISTSKQKAGQLIDWIGTYTYPSRKSTKNFRKQIKLLTSNIQNYQSFDLLFKSINSLIRGWSNYFSPAPHQIHLRRHLDTYIWKRLRKFVMNKYQHSFHDIFIQHFTREVDNSSLCLARNGSIRTRARSNKNVFYHRKSKTYRIWLQSPTIQNSNIDKGNLRSSSINVLNLTKLNMVSMWSVLVPTYDLLNNSPLIDNSSFIKRALLIAKFRRDPHSRLSFKQNHICPLCKNSLISTNALLGTAFTDSINELINNSNPEINDLEEPQHSLDNTKENIDNIISLNNSFSSKAYWLPNVEIDHILPKAIGGTSHELSSILDRKLNMQLVHKICHKSKREQDKVIIKEYRRIRKTLLPNNLNTYSEKELLNATYKIILEMHDNKLFENCNKQIIALMVKVSKTNLPKSARQPRGKGQKSKAPKS